MPQRGSAKRTRHQASGCLGRNGLLETNGLKCLKSAALSPAALNYVEFTYRHHVPVTTLDLENGSRGFASFACK